MVITFDFDDTLKLTMLLRDEDGDIAGIGYTDDKNPVVFPKFKAALKRGDEVHIVTSRNWSEVTEEKMKAWLLGQGITRLPPIHFTGGELKRDKLQDLGSQIHYDDDDAEGEALAGTPTLWVRAPLHRSWRPPGEEDAKRNNGRYLAESLVRRWVRALVRSGA